MTSFIDDELSRRPRLQKKKKPAQNTRSKGQLQHRSSTILSFAPWVEAHRQPATDGAMAEEQRLKKIIKEKEDRLREFQREVKERVRNLEKLKREEQHGMSVEAFEVERSVVQQSSFPNANSCSVRRDNCTYRDTSEVKIQRCVIQDHSAVDVASQLLDDHASEIRNCSKHARNVLSSKSLGAEEVDRLSQLLPGGLWRTSHLKDHGSVRQGFQPASYEDSYPQTGFGEKTGDDDYWVGENAILDGNNDQWFSKQPEAISTSPESGLETLNLKVDKGVHFSRNQNQEIENPHLENGIVKGKTIEKENKKPRAVETLIQPGKVLEEKKKRAKCQVAVYRRLFMDIEREQVRENIRMREHRRRMEALKVEKEIERLEIEQQQLERLKTERVKLEEEAFLAARRARQKEMDFERKHRKLRKERETERYIEALQAVLREKLESRSIVLPPLCSCGPTVWDANPNTCANNCVFYKNPKAYANALSTLLASSNPM